MMMLPLEDEGTRKSSYGMLEECCRGQAVLHVDMLEVGELGSSR